MKKDSKTNSRFDPKIIREKREGLIRNFAAELRSGDIRKDMIPEK
jgi:hypothetical protein